MKNLKKGLSVFLGMLMLLSLMTYASAANMTYADLSDKDQIQNQEAVSLLVDLGIIQGMPDGSYSPTVTIDRATMAKLVCYVLMGDVDQSVFKGTTTDLTDIDGNWAEGYIKFCYANGIIAGRGNGIFDPSAKVTVVEAAKMLCVALGYDAAIQGYIYSDSWSVNIMKDANKSGMLDGVSLTATDDLDRDNAALMIYNILFAKEVYYTDFTGSLPQYKNNTLGLATYGLVEFTGYVGYVDTDSIWVWVENSDGTWGYYEFAITAEPTLIGRKITVYGEVKTTQTTANFVTSTSAVADTSAGNDYTLTDTISSSAVIVDNVLATVSNGTAYDKLADKTNSKYIGYQADTSVEFYYNGVDYTGTADTDTDGVPNKIETAAGNIGTVLQFVDQDNNGKYDAVYATEYFLSVVSDTAAASTGKEATVTVTGIDVTGSVISYASGSNDAVAESRVVGDFSALAEDDYVMAAVIGAGTSNMLYVYEPTAFVGTMTKYNTTNQTLTVDGTTYTTMESYYDSSALPVNESDLTLANGYTFTSSSDATLYKDANGYIVAFGAVESDKNYVAIDSIVYNAASGLSDGYAQAKLVFTDGSASVVTISEINGVDASTVGLSTTAATNDAAYKGVIYTYSVDSDGSYEITKDTSGTWAAGTTITKGVATIGTAGIATTNTTYVVKTLDSSNKGVYTVYTGYKNMTSITGATTLVDVANDTNGYAAFVYVDATGSTVGDASKEVVYVLDTGYTTDTSGTTPIYEFRAIVNGAIDAIQTKSTTVKNTLAAAAGADLYEVTYDGTYVTSVAAQDATTSYVQGTAVANAANGVLKVDTDGNTATIEKVYTYDASETVYIYDESDDAMKTGTVADVKNTNGVYVKVVDAAGSASEQVEISVIYVIVP